MVWRSDFVHSAGATGGRLIEICEAAAALTCSPRSTLHHAGGLTQLSSHSLPDSDGSTASLASGVLEMAASASVPSPLPPVDSGTLSLGSGRTSSDCCAAHAGASNAPSPRFPPRAPVHPPPSWLALLFQAPLFDTCPAHSSHRRSEANYFCLSCASAPGATAQSATLCASCLDGHALRCPGAVFQVRKYMYQLCIRVEDVAPHLDCEGVQSYCINARRALLIHPKPVAASGVGSVLDSACRACSRPLRSDCQFCSIRCRAAVVYGMDDGLGTAGELPRAASGEETRQTPSSPGLLVRPGASSGAPAAPRAFAAPGGSLSRAEMDAGGAVASRAARGLAPGHPPLSKEEESARALRSMGSSSPALWCATREAEPVPAGKRGGALRGGEFSPLTPGCRVVSPPQRPLSANGMPWAWAHHGAEGRPAHAAPPRPGPWVRSWTHDPSADGAAASRREERAAMDRSRRRNLPLPPQRAGFRPYVSPEVCATVPLSVAQELLRVAGCGRLAAQGGGGQPGQAQPATVAERLERALRALAGLKRAREGSWGWDDDRARARLADV